MGRQNEAKELSPIERYQLAERKKESRSRAKRVLARLLELTVIVLGFLGSNQIARFLTAKITMDLVVEVTARFGAEAGHALSTFAAMIVAEPRIIAFAIAGVVVAADLICTLIRALTKGRAPRDIYDI